MPKPKDTAAETKGSDWRLLHLWQIQGVRDVLVFLAVFGLLWLGQKTSVVTVPLLLAILFAYLLEPVIVWLMAKCRVQRRTAVVAIMSAVVVGVAIPAVVGVSIGVAQLTTFTTRSIDSAAAVREALSVRPAEPEPQGGAAGAGETDGAAAGEADGEAAAQETESDAGKPRDDPREVRAVWAEFASNHADKPINKTWLWVYDKIAEAEREESTVGRLLDAAVGWIDANSDQIALTAAAYGAETVGRVVSFVGTVFGLTFTAFVTAFFFFFVSTEWVKLKGFGVRLLPDRNRDQIVHLMGRFDEVISGFIRGRLTIAFLQSFVFSIGYFVIGVPAAFILGPIVAVLSIVPYLALVGVPVSIVLLALSADQTGEGLRSSWVWIIGAPTVFYFFCQALDDYVWTPIIQGKSTGMDTPTILFASLAGGALFGVFGLLIAIPIAACLKILIQEVFWPRFKDWAEGREKDFLPIGRE